MQTPAQNDVIPGVALAGARRKVRAVAGLPLGSTAKVGESAMVNFASAIMTMKSARESKIINSLDVGGEALAQYLLTGGIRFNQFDTLVDRFGAQQAATEQRYKDRGYKIRDPEYHINPKVDPGTINKMIYAAEKNSMVACRETLKSMVGKVFWF